MTISSEAIKSSVFAGNGSTTAFAISFKTFSQSDLTVTLTSAAGVEAVKTLTTNYTVSLNANQDNSPGGTVTMGVAPASGEKLVIANEPAYTQSSDIVNGGGFFPNVIEDMVDRNTILSRRAQELTSRSVQIPQPARQLSCRLKLLEPARQLSLTLPGMLALAWITI